MRGGERDAETRGETEPTDMFKLVSLASRPRCGTSNPGGRPCGWVRGHGGAHEPEAYGPEVEGEASMTVVERRLARVRASFGLE